MRAVSDSADGAPSLLQRERTVFAVTGALATLVASLVDGLLVGMARLEGDQLSDPHAGAKSLYLLACLAATALAVWSAATTRTRPRRASLLGAAAVVCGTAATVAVTDALHFSGREAQVMLLAIWLFLTSPLDVAVVMGVLPPPLQPHPMQGPLIALGYVGLSTVLLIFVVFESQNHAVAWGALIVWLLLTSAITTLGVRGRTSRLTRRSS